LTRISTTIYVGFAAIHLTIETQYWPGQVVGGKRRRRGEGSKFNYNIACTHAHLSSLITIVALTQLGKEGGQREILKRGLGFRGR
jgi:hypothetical protein